MGTIQAYGADGKLEGEFRLEVSAESARHSHLHFGRDEPQWAERWVGPAEKDAFHQALLAAAAGREGRWTSSDGGVGIATPARIVGGCRVVEVMLTNDGGLPIRSRGTVTECP